MSSYLLHGERTTVTLRNAIRSAVKALTPHTRKFGTILVTGQSGMVVGAPLAYLMRKHIVIVRKPGEESHGSTVEGRFNGESLFLDDFVVWGGTMKRVFAEAGMPAFVYLYRQNDSARLDATFDYDGRQFKLMGAAKGIPLYRPTFIE